VEDGDLSANLALLQLILPVALGQGLRHCDPETWRMLELPSRLLQTLSVGESDRG
jgi:hypothetical protein